MQFILPSNKKDFEGVAAPTAEKYFAVNWQNKSWPYGLRQLLLLVLSKRLTVAPLRLTRFFVRISDSCRQQSFNITVSRA